MEEFTIKFPAWNNEKEKKQHDKFKKIAKGM